MSDGEHVVVNLKDLLSYSTKKRKISPKLNILEQGFRKGKIRDKKFYYFQLFKFISAVFCRGGKAPKRQEVLLLSTIQIYKCCILQGGQGPLS